MSASDKKKLRKEQNAAALTEKQRKEQKEAKKLRNYTITFGVVMLLVVAIVVGVALRGPVQGVINQNTHAITFGEHKLTTTDFSYYYVDSINNYCTEVYNAYVESLGNFWSMFLGFDLGKPLDEQMYDKEKGITWAQWFVEEAIDDAKQTYALYEAAIKNGHKPADKDLEYLDQLLKNASSLNKSLRQTYGNGANAESYRNYLTVGTYASSYLAEHAESLEYTNDDIREYEKDKFLNYTKFDYSFYTVNVSSYLGEGTKDEDGNITYTDKQKADALAAAKKDADTLVNKPIISVQMFNEAIKALEINKENKNAACVVNTDVFYEDLGYEEIQEWMSNDDRKVNELGSIEIKNKTGEGEDAKEEVIGYIVVLFQERDDCYNKLISVRHIFKEFTYIKDSSGNQKVDEAGKPKLRKQAEDWLEEWKSGAATQESFAELANKYSEDGDGTTGGLYEDVFPGSTYDDAFDKWCFDKNRKPGDTEVIESEMGYHVMYFVETQDKTYRDLLIETDMITEDVNELMEDLKKNLKVEQINLKGLEWDYVV